MELVGRRPEVDRITTIAALPRESALVVLGDPGQGKSTLLDTVAGRVTTPVVRVSVNASESRWPLAGLTTLFAALDDPRAAAHAGRLVRDAAGSDDGLATAHELLEAVRGLQMPSTLVLIDDLDLMDTESQRLIAFLAGRLAGTSLRIVATARTACAESPLSSLPSVRIEPLDLDEALTLARSIAPHDANDGVLATVAAESGGNPAALREHLASLRHDQLTGTGALVLPLRPTPVVDAVAQHRLACADEHDVEVLARMALAPTVRLPAPGFDRDTIDDLADAGLVTVRGQHATVADPLVRSHLHWRMSSRERRTAHAELAAHAAADTALTGGDLRAAAWHASFVDDTADVESLLAAASAYAAEDMTDAAAMTAERALLLGVVSHRHQSALLRVAEVLVSRRRLGLGDRYLAAIGAFPTLLEDVRRLRLQYAVEFLQGEPVHADELLLPIDPANEREADAFAGLLALVASFRAESWETDGARDALARADALGDRVGPATREVLDAARDLLAAVDGTLPADARLHDGLSASRLLEMSDPSLLLLAHALSLSERYQSARRVFALVLARSTQTEPVWLEAARYLSAENEVRAGSYRQALRAIDVWESGSPVAERLREPSRAIAIAWRHFAEGRADDAVRVVDQALAHRSSGRLWATTAKLHALRGRVTMLDGRIDEALASLEAADAIGRSLRNPTVLRHLGDLVEAYVRLGRMDDARRVTARFAADHHGRPSRWGSLVLARCLALVADDTTRQTAQRRALETFEANDSQYERARTLLALAVVGAPQDRARLRAAAAAAFEAAGVRRAPGQLADQPRAVLPAFGSPVSVGSPISPEGVETTRGNGAASILTMLTAEERSVVQKVTEGFRNKEIAASLYMSQRTVELRLTQIYRKVGARSRSHLVALLG